MSDTFIKHGLKVQKSNYYPSYARFIQDSFDIIPEAHTRPIRSSAISSDSSLLVTSGEDMKVLVWSLPSFKIEAVLRAHDHSVNALAISSNNLYVASASQDFLIIIWDLEIKDLYTYFTTQRATVWALDISPNNEFVAAGCSDKKIKIWDIHTENLIWNQEAHSKPLKSLKFMKNLQIVSAGDDKVNVWDFQTKKFSFNLKGHKSIVTTLALSLDEEYLASGGTNGIVFIWKIAKKLQKYTLRALSAVSCMSFSEDSEYLAVCNASFKVMIFEIRTAQLINEYSYHHDFICLVSLNLEKNSVLSVSSDKRIRLLTLPKNSGFSVKDHIKYEKQHLHQVTTVTFTSDKRLMITSGEGKEIKIWDTESQQLLIDLYSHTSAVPTLRLSTDDELLISTSHDQKLILWNFKSFEIISNISNPNDVCLSACFCNNNKFIVTGGNDGIRLWDIKKQKQIGAVQCSKTRADSLTLTKDEKYLVTASGETTSHRVHIKNGDQIIALSAVFKFFVWNFKNFMKKLDLIE